jgi:probable HAF family extracellular repeat protein
MTDLGTFGGVVTVATCINDAGQVVGESDLSTQGGDAFLWQNGQLTDIGSLGTGGSYAYGINKSGQIVGQSGIAVMFVGSIEATLWNGGIITDLGNLGGDTSIGIAINESGQVAGYANTSRGSDIFHPFLWQNGVMTDLITMPVGSSGSKAYAINNAGQVVGFFTPPGGVATATIWQNGVMTDLNTLIPANTGWQLVEAWGINDSGQIVGDGQINGNAQSFLLTPYPTANPQTVSLDLGTPTAIKLTGMDHDSPPLKLKYAIAVQPANGKLTGLNTSTGAVTYTPDAGFKGTDSFTFTVNNGTVTSAAAKVTLSVEPGTPTALSQTVSVAHNTAAKFTLTGTDPNMPTLPLTFAIKTSPTHGTLSTLNATTGAVTYTPSSNFGAADSFTFTVSNGTKTSEAAKVILNVAPGIPTANAQTVAVAHNVAKSITLTGKDPDVPALPLTFAIVKGPVHGALGTLNSSTGAVTYTPVATYYGPDSLTFTVTNGTNTSTAATVTLNVAIGTPTANAQNVSVAHNTAKAITLTGSDPDSPALKLTFAIATSPAHGTLSTLNTASGAVTYTPSANYQGTDSFTFTVTNGTYKSAAATVSLKVAPGTPTANPQTVTVLLNTRVTITLTGSDPDNPALKLSFAIATTTAHGILGSLNTSTGVLVYTPDGNYKGTDSFTFTVSNGTNKSTPAKVMLNVDGG